MAKAKTSTAKKPAAKPKATTARTTAKPTASKSSKDPKKPLTKTQFITEMSERTQLTKAQVDSALETMFKLVTEQVSSGNPGKITIPTLGIQIVLKDVPAKPKRVGPVPGKPGETMTYPAKPASRQIKVKAMTALRETAEKKKKK